MHPMFSGLVFVAAVGIFTGCNSVKVSNRDPFYDYVGRTVELREPAAIVARHGYWHGGKGVMSRKSVAYGLVNGSGQGYGQVFAILPPGHKVYLEGVWDEVAGDGQQIVAYGRTTIPPGTNEVRFAYVWGLIWTLSPAPWEPEDTPKRRAPPAPLPPHFNYEMFKTPPDAPKWGTRVREK